MRGIFRYIVELGLISLFSGQLLDVVNLTVRHVLGFVDGLNLMGCGPLKDLWVRRGRYVRIIYNLWLYEKCPQ